jgi:GT2 family glycosyltransferase
MAERPLVSIVVPFRDEERFLGDAVASVLAQTYDAWELLLVDDGSRDGSTALARELARAHPGRIHYLEHEGHANLGTSVARNLGIAHAKGESLAFLDADDVFLPDRLERELPILLASSRIGMVWSLVEQWHGWTGRDADRARDRVIPHDGHVDRVIEPPELLLGLLEPGRLAPSPSGVLLRREVVERAGGFEPSFTGMHDDQAFFAKVFLATPVFRSARCVARYRQHADSCYTRAKREGTRAAAERRFVGWLAGYLRPHLAAQPALRRALARRRRRLRHPRLAALQATAARAGHRLVRALTARLPDGVRGALRRALARHRVWPPVGAVRMGSLRRLTPISRRWGADRGQPVDRYYIERFLQRHAADIRGRVLEIGDDRYARRYGGERVERVDVLDVRPTNDRATIVADLGDPGDRLPAGAFDCVLLCQTLMFVWDVGAALRAVHRALKPGGVVLATLGGITQTASWDGPWYWRFTGESAHRFFAAVFPARHVSVSAEGNVLAAIAMLHGLAVEDLRPGELHPHDPAYEVVVLVRAGKPSC